MTRIVEVVVVATLATACADAPAPAVAADETFATLCARCHGRDGHGGEPPVPGGPRPRDFTDRAWQATRTDAQLAQVIRDGKPPMPAFAALLAGDQITAVVARIRRFGEATR